MYHVSINKRRLNVIIPAKVYDRIDAESNEYGITKSSIISTALVEHYKRIDSLHTPVGKDAGCCQGTVR